VVQFFFLPVRVHAAPPPGFLAGNAPPSWIWFGPGGENQTIYLRRAFEITSPVTAAKLVVAADDHATVYLDGQQLFAQDRWEEPGYKDVTAAMTPGRHLLAVRAKNDKSAAGFLLRLSFESAAGSFALLSDGSWLASGSIDPGWQDPPFNDSKWSAATVLAPLGGKPWDKVTEPSLVTATKQRDPSATPPDRIKIAKDFKVELLYSVPKDSQGSWVNLCTDPKGRLYVSDQYGPLYRITPPPVGKPAAEADAQRGC